MMDVNNNEALNELIVVKRSGQRVGFNSTKIAIAIKKAFDHVSPDNYEKHINKVYEDVLLYINSNYGDRKTINVEDIQDIIETKLRENKFNDVYRAFSDYRIRRAASRQAFGIKQQHKFAKAIERIVNDNRENKYANDKPNDILLDFGKTVSCEYTKTYVLDNKFVRAHEEGSIYIHNLDYFNLGKLSSTHLILDNNIEEDFFTKFISLLTLAKNEIDGEIAIDSVDNLLVTMFIKKFKNKFKDTLTNYLRVTDYLDYINLKKIEEIIDKENSIYFDINLFSQYILNDKVSSIFRQSYDDSMDMVLKLLSTLFKNLVTTLEHNYQENKKYSITLGANNSYEGLIINNCYLDVISKMETLHNVATIFNVKNDSDKDLILKASTLVVNGKNISFAFIDTKYNQNNNIYAEYFSDGKRIFDNPVYDEKSSNGRMIVSSVSINIGRLGFKYENKNINDFYFELDELLDISKNCLVSIFETIGDKNKENYSIIFNNNILDDDKLEAGQKIRKVIKKGVLNLELAGLLECILLLEKDELKQKKLLENILKHVKEKCEQYTVESKLNFVVSETSKHRPLRKLMELDKAIYGIRKGINDKTYYERIEKLFTYKKELDEDLNYISKYQTLLTGGNLVKIPLSKSTKEKDVFDIIQNASSKEVGFIKFEVRR
jgi:ribonucleoside-triphosphate reductase